jgi:hypothetical protein
VHLIVILLPFFSFSFSLFSFFFFFCFGTLPEKRKASFFFFFWRSHGIHADDAQRRPKDISGYKVARIHNKTIRESSNPSHLIILLTRGNLLYFDHAFVAVQKVAILFFIQEYMYARAWR